MGLFIFRLGLFLLTALLALVLLVGCYTRVATIGSWILLASLYNRAPFSVNGGDTYLVVLLFWAMFLPLGRCWSVDAYRSRHRACQEKTIFSAGTFAILIQIFLIYFCSGCYKIFFHSDPGMLLEGTLVWADYNRPIGHWLLHFPSLLWVLSWTALAFELLAPWLLFSPWKTNPIRLWILAGFVVLHVGIELTLTVALFSYISLAALTLFLPAQFWGCFLLVTTEDLFYWLSAHRQTGNRIPVNWIAPISFYLAYPLWFASRCLHLCSLLIFMAFCKEIKSWQGLF